MMILQGNTEKIFHIWLGSDFLDMTPNTQATKGKNKQDELHEKLKNVPQNMSKSKKASYIYVKWLISRIYKGLLKNNNKSANNF
jgi:hypothetical protein